MSNVRRVHWPGHGVPAGYQRAGAYLYLAGAQYFLTQLWVATRFTPGYSLTRNTISDLGNTACGRFNGRQVCSPAHAWMNVSLIVLGATMVVGSALVYRGAGHRRFGAVGFAAFSLGGVGAAVAGRYPENTIPAFHGVGAALPFLVGNLGVLVVGVTVPLPGWLRLLTVAAGALSLAALVCYATHLGAGIGEGGMERLVAYPQTVWMIVFGGYTLARSAR